MGRKSSSDREFGSDTEVRPSTPWERSEQLTSILKISAEKAQERALDIARGAGDTSKKGDKNQGRSLILSWMLLRRGRYKEAVQMLESLALESPNDPLILKTLAWALEKSGERGMAQAIFALVGHLNVSDDAGAEEVMATIFASGENLADKKAVTRIERALETSIIALVPGGWENDKVRQISQVIDGGDLSAVKQRPVESEDRGKRRSSRDEKRRRSSGRRSSRDRDEPELDLRADEPENDIRGDDLEDDTESQGGNFAFRTQAGERQIPTGEIFGNDGRGTRGRGSRSQPGGLGSVLTNKWVWVAVAGAFLIVFSGVLTWRLLFGGNYPEERNLGAWLRSGDLEALAIQVPIDGSMRLPGEPSHALLALRAEAVLFRFHDAAEGRYARVTEGIETLEEADVADKSALLIPRLLVQAGGERLPALAELLRAPSDPLNDWLLADTYRRLGRPEDASAAFERLLANPDSPPYLLAITAHELHRMDQKRRVRSIGARVMQDAEESGWAKFVFELGRRGDGITVDPNDLPAVPRAELAFFQAEDALERGRPAREQLDKLMAALGSAGFLLDYVDRLLMAKKLVPARHILKTTEWKQATAAAHATAGWYHFLDNRRKQAVDELLVAWRAGVRDPISGQYLASLLAVEGKPAIPPTEVWQELSNIWPDDRNLAFGYARALYLEKKYDIVVEIMEEVIHEFRRAGSNREQAEAYYVLAAAEMGRGNRQSAEQYAKRALAKDSDHEGAKRLLRRKGGGAPPPPEEAAPAPKTKNKNKGKKKRR